MFIFIRRLFYKNITPQIKRQTFTNPIGKPVSVLRVHSSAIPESYIKEFKYWDESLYTNKTIVKDV